MKLTLLVAAAVGVAVACSASGGGNGASISGPPLPDGTGGSGSVVDLDATSGPPSDNRNLPVRKKTCDDAGNCTCLRLAVLGTLDTGADEKDTTPFRDWLNGNSGGTATVTMVPTKPVLDATFLGQYDILLVANVNGWTFSSDEKAAVETWVRTTGGGIITLTGFMSNSSEPGATSQLVDFAGMGYTTTETAPEGTSQSQPVYYQNGATNLKDCLIWNPSTGTPWITDPIKFIPQSGSLEKLTFKLDYVGAFKGFGVKAPAGATVVAIDTLSGQNMAAALELDGTGRIFTWGDEWVMLANQWAPPAGATCSRSQPDQYNPCWVPPADGGTDFFHSVATLYQTKQFWYDAINWVAPPNECSFKIEDKYVVIY
jgi:hypothetical protein